MAFNCAAASNSYFDLAEDVQDQDNFTKENQYPSPLVIQKKLFYMSARTFVHCRRTTSYLILIFSLIFFMDTTSMAPMSFICSTCVPP